MAISIASGYGETIRFRVKGLMQEQSRFGLWRVGVVGTSHRLPTAAARMCELLGECLVRERTVLLVHGGLKRRSQEDSTNLAADWHFVEGARRCLQQNRDERIETVLPEPDLDASTPTFSGRPGREGDDPHAEMFIEGALRRIKGRTREARRFGFVNSLDALVAVGGGYGTRQQLTMAAAVEKPVLPVPCFDGAAREFWNNHRGLLLDQLNIEEDTAVSWETEPATAADVEARAEAMVSALLARLPKRAFVIMPFASEHDTLYDLVIEPAVTAVRDEICRLDRMQAPGGVTGHIEQGIRTSDYCVVVLDEMRPNVMFEMGYAYALGKPLILLLRKGQVQESEIPFDISTLQRIEYLRPDAGTLRRLKEAVRLAVRRSTV